MDEQGIDTQVLSINPFWYGLDRDRSRELISFQNERLAAMCAAQSSRFVGLATTALQHPDLAAQQLEEGIKKFGFRGAAIGGNVNGDEIADPKFEPFWAQAEALGASSSSTRRAFRLWRHGSEATASFRMSSATRWKRRSRYRI